MNDRFNLFAFDAILPDQFAEMFRRSEQLEPEKALLWAVLEDAVGCVLKFHSAQDRIGKKQFQETEEWIMQSGSDWFFSFENVCELLELDPEYLRRGLRQWTAKGRRQKKVARHPGLRRHAA